MKIKCKEQNIKILLQGDTHGNKAAILGAFSAAEKSGAELVVVVGDFGYGWDGTYANGSPWLYFVSKQTKNYNVPLMWLDGNHENFDLLEAEGAFGAEGTKDVAPGVTYVPRGMVLTLGSSNVLFMGGAYSVDKPRRTPHVSWWPQEEITGADFERMAQNVEYTDRPVDIVLTHDAPDVAFRAALRLAASSDEDMEHLVWKNDQSFPGAKPNRMTLQAIYDFLKPKPALWVHGHYHTHYTARVSQGQTTEFVGLSWENNQNSRMVIEV